MHKINSEFPFFPKVQKKLLMFANNKFCCMDSDSSDTDSLEEWLQIPNPATHPQEAADWVCNSDFTHSLR